MPRSLTELKRVMPATTLLPYPVLSASFQTERWWMHAASLKLAFTDFVKFIPTARGTFPEGEGHLSIVTNYIEAIIADLRAP